jgi:hypothetical protein
MTYDFNSAERQANMEPIPAGTIVPLVMTIRPGGEGDGGWFTASKNSDAMMLDCEFTVAAGPYTRRKIWQFFVLSGGKLNDKGESVAGGISRSTLRAILESARNVDPNDMGEPALAKRRANWNDFCGLTFLAKLSIEKDKTGQYGDKNRIQTVITPGMKEYLAPLAPASAAPAAPAQTAPAASWASGQPTAPVQPPVQPPIQPPAPDWGTLPPPPANSGGNPVPAWAR